MLDINAKRKLYDHKIAKNSKLNKIKLTKIYNSHTSQKGKNSKKTLLIVITELIILELNIFNF